MIPCPCGCRNEYEALSGTVSVPGGLHEFFAYLTEHQGTKNAWLAIVTGPWSESDPRDVIVSLCTTWLPDGASSRIVDAKESPWSRLKVLKDDPGIRWADRADVLGQPGADRTYFVVHDAVTLGSPRIRKFFMGR
jgi:hypothetical protein